MADVAQVWVEVLGEPSSGTVADGLSVAAGEILQVSPTAARRLLLLKRARLVDPPVAETRKRTR